MSRVRSNSYEAQISQLPEPTRRRARAQAGRFEEEHGVSPDEAMERALYELDQSETRSDRRTGLRWDE